jgi:hypothetical protein
MQLGNCNVFSNLRNHKPKYNLVYATWKEIAWTSELKVFTPYKWGGGPWHMHCTMLGNWKKPKRERLQQLIPLKTATMEAVTANCKSLSDRFVEQKCCNSFPVPLMPEGIYFMVKEHSSSRSPKQFVQVLQSQSSSIFISTKWSVSSYQKSMAGNDSGSIVSHLTSLQILQNLRKWRNQGQKKSVSLSMLKQAQQVITKWLTYKIYRIASTA